LTCIQQRTCVGRCDGWTKMHSFFSFRRPTNNTRNTSPPERDKYSGSGGIRVSPKKKSQVQTEHINCFHRSLFAIEKDLLSSGARIRKSCTFLFIILFLRGRTPIIKPTDTSSSFPHRSLIELP